MRAKVIEGMKECENNTHTESVPDTKVFKAPRNFITFDTDWQFAKKGE